MIKNRFSDEGAREGAAIYLRSASPPSFFHRYRLLNAHDSQYLGDPLDLLGRFFLGGFREQGEQFVVDLQPVWGKRVPMLAWVE